jgi:Na+/proline symporter
MQIALIDWLIIAAYFGFVLFIGLKFSGRAGRNVEEFFVSGRSLPWWIAGTSMVATTFAADTPLAVTGLVAEHGIAGNWLWWSFVFSGMLTVFLFARLWRRSEVLTDIEFTEIRYGGRPAAILRGFRALYLAIPINSIIMGWVTLAMTKIISVTLNIDRWLAVAICVAITLSYSALSGLWGVVITDFFQFFLAVGGSLVLAYFALDAVGGMSGLRSQMTALHPDSQEIFRFVPSLDSVWMPAITFFVYLAVNWWAAWYPAAEPGGGGYVAQRMFSAKNEKHSLLATLWFNIAHYCLRPWPWILVALASMVLFPALQDKESGYVEVLVNYLPVGFRGLLLASFAAAYMSTISTQLNWGSSYLVNDFYKRFLKPNADPRHYVKASRWATVLLTVIGALVTLSLDTIAGAWKFLLAIGAGTGSVYILRWYWWRINAWSEISAMVFSFVTAMSLQFFGGLSSDDPIGFAKIMLITVSVSTAGWLLTTYLTSPENEEVLVSFYRKVRPGGRLWATVAEKAGGVSSDSKLGLDLLDWLLGCVLIYATLFGVGKLILGDLFSGVMFLAVAAVCGALIFADLSRRGWGVLSGEVPAAVEEATGALLQDEGSSQTK